MGLNGCHHPGVRSTLPPLPPILDQVDLLNIPRPTNLPLLEMPVVNMSPIPTAAAATRFPRERRRLSRTTASGTTTIPTQPVAGDKTSEMSSIGSLTVGGDATPQTRQAATEMIAALERRLNSTPTPGSNEKRAQLNTARNFWRDAQQALRSGDADGAKTLATKARLLLDEIEK